MAEKQDGFRRGRGCRDQILTLTLLGQTMMSRKKKGMLHSLTFKPIIGWTKQAMWMPGRSLFEGKIGKFSESSSLGSKLR